MKSNATKISRESTPYITLFTARSRIFLPAAIPRVALSWPPRKPTVFARLARWQLKVFERENSARNRKKAEKTETGKASIALIHAKTEIDRNYVCFNLPLHLKKYAC